MARRRNDHPSGLINLIIEAIAPALIIGMICCLVFFLVVAFYRGEFDLRLMYILGLFTLGVVLIARIAIESGRSYANGFAIPLAIVTILAMMRFVTVQGDLAPLSWLFNVGLLGLVWYLADRITYDCTWDDRQRKTRQEGLLQSLGLLPRPTGLSGQAGFSGESSPPHVLLGDEDVVKAPPETESRARHNPGVWVLRFALLALPLFGFGQLVISDPMARSRSFWFLFGYLACALGLLVATSLLSVRRYLHHRGAKMPAEVVSIWLCSGAIGVFLILALCILLPLPGRSLGLIELPFEIGSPDGLLSSRFGWGGEGSTDEQNTEAAKSESDQGEPSGAPEPDGKGPPQSADNAPKNAPQKNSDSGEQGESSKSNDSSRGEPAPDKSAKDAPQPKQPSQKLPPESSKKSGKKSQGNAADDKKAEARDAEQKGASGEQEPRNSGKERGSDRKIERQKNESQSKNSSSQRPNGSQRSSNFNSFMNSFNADFATLFKWLTIAVLVLFVVIYAITHPREVAKLLRDIADFFAALFGRKPTLSKQTPTSGQGTNLELRRALAPFSSYTNPFQSGEQLSGVIVVERTFSALESWAAEAGVTRGQDETSREFVGRLVASIPKLGKTPIQAANMLDQVMFAAWKPSARDLQALEQLWQLLTRPS